MGTTPFSTEQALQHWKNYVKTLDSNSTLFVALNRNISSQGSLLTLEVDNQTQIEVVNQNKETLLRYLKQHLNNSEIALMTKVKREDNTPIRNVTSNDKYNAFLQKNPLLEKFREELGLEINF